MAKYITDPTTGQRVKIEKSHKFRNFVMLPAVGIVALIVIIMVATGGGSGTTGRTGNGGADRAAAPAADKTSGHTVRYEITGDGTGLITYSTDNNGSQAQNSGVALPWHTDLHFPDAFYSPAIVSVQHSSGSGPITCKIIEDGKVLTENTSTGQYAVASCSASLK